ncbi:PP2C family protein-serine/threonine phosphatase [Herminiimonas fonticola]|uniref:Protein phosphatase n=1 Tax=Herminiimonas fonticola TaxID=303380 RepID=A0A4R6GIC6_9BURK|nr:PP2C family serine/threonine-protein phosphatase [Herminiimonas fonticola]RBA25650.1 Serine/threonine protein phosphatase [Herminiimonas fonticola]TDN94761.1 protein phosphatase [Herminiimonas fonticola]
MRFSVYQESHIGGRKNNQDRMGYSFTRDALLLLVADGMGGHIMGEMAAQIAMQTIASLFQENATPYVKKPERFLEDSFFAAHREIHRYRAINNLPETPRTTIVACLIQHNSAMWAHCGDSRLYWMRGGQILARTRDHSRIETLIAQGKVDASERETHPDRNKLFNCLGAPNMPIVEISRRASLQAGDIMLLCSDGLWSVLPDHELAQRLHSNTIVRAVPELLTTATGIAGKTGDNVTALAMMWESSENLQGNSTITTHTLPVGSVTTTIQAPRHLDLENADTYNDSDIEKAIEEIRNAIDKSSRITSRN